MKINELRVGNWFYRHCCNDQVMEVRAGGVIGLDNLRGIIPLHEMEPIPLTKEFFGKNGFVLQENSDYLYYRSSNMKINVVKTDEGWHIDITDREYTTVFCKVLKYVHELQNAYYVSTGEEMEIKL